MILAPEDVMAVAAAVVAKMPDQWLDRSPTCSTAEAMAYARIRSAGSWRRFCSKFAVQSVGGGRYSRTEVHRAAEREIREKRKIF